LPGTVVVVVAVFAVVAVVVVAAIVGVAVVEPSSHAVSAMTATVPSANMPVFMSILVPLVVVEL